MTRDDSERAERLKKALRDNLKRRKARQRELVKGGARAPTELSSARENDEPTR